MRHHSPMAHPLREWRLRKGLGASAFARSLTISYRTLHRIEAGESAPSLSVARAIELATAGEVSVEAILAYRAGRAAR